MNKRGDSGFTLFELVAALAVITIITAATIMTVQHAHKVSLSTSSSQIGVAIRYLYDLSVLNNRTYRLVIDMDEGAYWGEEIDVTQSRCGAGLLPSEEESRFGVGRGGSRQLQDQEDAPAPGIILKDNLLKRRELPKGIEFSGLMAMHLDDLSENGRGAVHFFPGGYIEKAYIYIRRNEEEYTIETVPLRGFGVVHARSLDPRNLMDGS